MANAVIFVSKLAAKVVYRRLAAQAVWRHIALTDLSYEPQIVAGYDAVAMYDAISLRYDAIQTDIIAALEEIGLLVAKPFGEIVSPADQASIEAILAKADGISIADVATFVVGKGLADDVFASETLLKSIGTAQADTVSAVESAFFDIAKALSDPVTMAEALSIAASVRFSDAISVDDAIAFIRPDAYNDSASTADSYLLGIGLGPSEIVTISEQFLLTFGPQGVPFSQLDALPLGEWTLGY